MTPPSRQRGMSVWPTVLRTARSFQRLSSSSGHVLVGVDDDRALVEPRSRAPAGLGRAEEAEARRREGQGEHRGRGPARRRSFSCAGGYNSAMRTPPRFQPLDFERLAETESAALRRVSRAHRDPSHRPRLLGRARAALADRERRARRVARAVGGQPPALAIRRRLRRVGQDGHPRRRGGRGEGELRTPHARGVARSARSARHRLAQAVSRDGAVPDRRLPHGLGAGAAVRRGRRRDGRSRGRTTTSPSPSGSPADSCSRRSTSRASRP